jgi:hypothetical protein
MVELTTPAVIAIVLFGDPGNRGNNLVSPLGGHTLAIPPSYANKVKENCAYNDPICSFSGTDINAHLSYSSAGTNFIEDSANFIFNEYETHGNSGPSEASFGRPGTEQVTAPTAANIAAVEAVGVFLGGTGAVCP